MSGGHSRTDASCTITFVGTATTLLQLGPFNLLTDPNFALRGQWVHVGHGIVTRRRTHPAMTIEELPALDAVVLSHLHGDHFDRAARRHLDRHLPQPFITPTQLDRWRDATDALLREGLFRSPEAE